jgi:hypothetical protein
VVNGSVFLAFEVSKEYMLQMAERKGESLSPMHFANVDNPHLAVF